MLLPTISQEDIGVRPIDWSGFTEDQRRKFLNPGEAEALIALMRSVKPRRVVEFGANNGRTAKLILQNIPGIERYIGIEVPHGYVTGKVVQRGEVPEKPGELAFSDPRFRLWVSGRGSHDIADDELSYGSAEAVFIDGDHSEAGVCRDLELAAQWVAPGGIVICHDYHSLETVDVRKVLDERYQAGVPWQHVKSTWLAFTRF